LQLGSLSPYWAQKLPAQLAESAAAGMELTVQALEAASKQESIGVPADAFLLFWCMDWRTFQGKWEA